MGHPVPALLYSVLFCHEAGWVMVAAFVAFGFVYKAIITTSVKSLYLSAVSYTSLNTCVISLKRSSPNSLKTPGTIIISCRLFIPHLHGSKQEDIYLTRLLHIAKDVQLPVEGMSGVPASYRRDEKLIRHIPWKTCKEQKSWKTEG